MKIFGIDPGLRSTGWGVVTLEGHHLSYCGDGVIRPDAKESDARRLHKIAETIDSLMLEHQPEMVCIEDVFVSKNPSSALKLGMARGAAITAVARHDIQVVMISARRVKQNITGSGRADKSQVMAMVSRLLNVTPKNNDSADALAIAIAGMNDQPVEALGQARPESGLTESGLTSAIEKALAKEDAP